MSRTRDGAGRVEGPGGVRHVEQEGKSGARSRRHARTHKWRAPTHAQHLPSHARKDGHVRWWGGKRLPVGLMALLPEKVAWSLIPLCAIKIKRASVRNK